MTIVYFPLYFLQYEYLNYIAISPRTQSYVDFDVLVGLLIMINGAVWVGQTLNSPITDSLGIYQTPYTA